MQEENKPKINSEFPLDPPDQQEDPRQPLHDTVDSVTGEIIDRKQVPKRFPGNAPIKQHQPQQKQGGAAIAKKEPKSEFIQLLNQKKNALQNFLGDEKNALVFMSAVRHCMDKVPELANCDHDSLLGAFMECAALGLFPGNASGDCYVLPYGKKAQFQLGYQGIKTLAYRSGVLRVWSDIICKNDLYEEMGGTNPYIKHKKPDFGKPRGEIIGVFACAEVTPGSVIYKSMSMDEIMEIKKISRAADSKYSPWNSGNDPNFWMGQKTCIKQLGKTMPKSDKLQRAIYLDNVSERGGYINNDHGDVIEASFETNESKINSVQDKKAQLRERKK